MCNACLNPEQFDAVSDDRIETRTEQLERENEELKMLLKAGYNLSTEASAINWRARDKDNTGEWLDELKVRLEAFQELAAAFDPAQYPPTRL